MKISNWEPSSRLLLGLDKETKETYTSKYKYSKDLLGHILDMLQKDLDSALREQDEETLFSSPNWELHQAYLSGKRQALRSVIHLLKPKN